LGRHRKLKRSQISRRLTTAAVPAVAGAAAVLCLAPQAQASPLPAIVSLDHATAAQSLARVGQSPAQLLAASREAVASTPATYTVRSGDSLSKIAGRVYHDQAAWPVIYWANRSKVRSANDISAGQVLRIPAKPAHIPNAPAQVASVVVTASQSGGVTYAPAETASTYSGGGGFASCVIARESGGNSQVMNSSGHYGLYQFSESTWEAYGGSASDFGDASVAEQNQVFDNALARGGQSNWSAYDGC
jgi:resuscitation-promoting factor RpfB